MKSLLLLPLVLGALVSCGGGGGGGGSTAPSYTITTNSSSISATVFDHQWACTNYPITPATVNGRISPVPTSRVYAAITLNNNGFDPAATQVYVYSDGSFTANFYPDSFLPVGTYSGTLSLGLFSDAAYTVPLGVSGGNLSFTAEVKPQLSVSSILVNGSPLSAVHINTQNHEGSIGIVSGDLLELDTNIPVNWVYSSGPGLVVVAPVPGSTSTAWTAHLNLAAIPSINSIDLIGNSQSGPGQAIKVHVMVS